MYQPALEISRRIVVRTSSTISVAQNAILGIEKTWVEFPVRSSVCHKTQGDVQKLYV